MGSLMLTNPAGLWALLGLPALLFIHLFRQRFRRRQVSGLFLWQDARQAAPAGRRVERLYNSKSLWFELIAVLLLALLAAGPRWVHIEEGRHLVVVLDQSASMGARPEGGESFVDDAKAQVRRRMEEFSRISVILTGPRPVLIAGPAAERQVASAALDAWTPMLTAHDVSPAMQLAAQVGGGSASILYVTDTPPSGNAMFPEATILSVGAPVGNVAILGARRTLDLEKGGSRIFFRLANFSREERGVPVTLWDGDTPLYQQSTVVAAGAEANITLQAPPGDSILRIEIGSDALAIDNVALVPLQGTRRVAVRNDLPAGRAKEDAAKALRAVPYTDLVDAGQPCDAVVRAPDGPAVPDAWELLIGAAPEDRANPDAMLNFAGPYIIEPSHAMMQNLLMDGVLWGGAGQTAVEQGSIPLLSAGNTALISQLPGFGAQRYWFNIDMARTNVAKSLTWPMLFANWIELRRRHFNGLARPSFRVGEPIEVTLPQRVRQSGVRYRARGDAEWRTLKAVPGPTQLPPLDSAGLYDLELGEEAFGVFAVNFEDAQESNLLHADLRERAAAADPELAFMMRKSQSFPIAVLCLAALGLILLHWHGLQREPLG